MSLNNFGLGFIFQGVDRVSGIALKVDAVMTRVEKSATRAHRALDSATALGTAGMATMALGVGGLNKAFAAADMAGGFQQGLAGIGAVAKASAEEMTLARQSVIKAGMDTQFSPNEALAGMQQLVTAGQTIQESTKTLLPVLDLAAGSLGNLSVDSAADAVVGTLNSYGMSADKATAVTNQLLRVTQLTNFATNDFSGALAKAASNGAMFGTNLDDTLITVGLLRNANIDASSAGTGFRESIRRVATMSAQQDKVLAAGVEVYDKTSGKMRSIVDITLDLIDATKDWDEAKRSEMLGLVYGSRGLLAYNAIQRAQFKTMKDGALVTYEGRDAVQRLRAEMAISEGNIERLTQLTAGWTDQQEMLDRATTEAGKTAQEFREKLLDTYQGQKTLVVGILETLGILSGEAMAKAFKPVLKFVADSLTKLAAVIEGMSPELKMFMSKLFVGASLLALFAGGFVTVKFAMVAFSATLRLVGLSVGGLSKAFLILGLKLALIAAAAYLIYRAYKTNFGGFADFVNRVWVKVKLLYNGLRQVFSQGGFSGAVRKELNKAENAGLKRFIINVYAFVHRLGILWDGMKDGFMSVWNTIGPVIEEIGAAFQEVLGEWENILGPVFQLFDDGTSTSVSGWRKFGIIFGRVAGLLIKGFAYVILYGIKLYTWILRAVQVIAKFYRTYVSTIVSLGIKWAKIVGTIIWWAAKIAWTIGKVVVVAVMVLVGILMFLGKIWWAIVSFIVEKAIWLGSIWWTYIGSPLWKVAKAIASFMYGMWQFIYANVITPLVGAFWMVVGAMKNVGKAIWNWVIKPIASIVRIVIGPLLGVFEKVWGAVVAGWNYAKAVVWDKFGWIIEGIIAKVRELIDEIKALWEWIPSLEDVTTGAKDAAWGAASAVGSGVSDFVLGPFGGGSSALTDQLAAAQASNTSPAVAQAEQASVDPAAQRAAMEQLAAKMGPLLAVMNKVANRPVILNVDGAKLAESVDDNMSRSDALSYSSE